MDKPKFILWDFDGVIINSDTIRTNGFARVLQSYPEHQVAQLLEYHQANGGLSRYHKFSYFFEEIRKEPVSEEQIVALAEAFSRIMRQAMTDKSLLIEETVSFIKAHHKRIPMHIVSGSDQQELRYLCQCLEIDSYFVSIHGSPTPKKQLVKDLLLSYQYKPEEGLLIGDAINDFDAAQASQVAFWGYGNDTVRTLSTTNFSLNIEHII